jgi:Xaa-Pro dipeptidase
MISSRIIDPVCAGIEKRFPASNDDPIILEIAGQKIERLRNWINEKGFDSVLLSRCENFAWLTVGGDNHVVINSEFGTGHLLITPKDQFLLAYTMDGPRLMNEQVKGQGYSLVTNDWFSGDPRLNINKLGGDKIASDSNFPGTQDCSGEILLLHDPMSALEKDRLRWLGRTTGLVFEQAAPLIHPGMTEWEIAAIFKALFHLNLIDLDVLLVGTDERAMNIRHFIPSQRRLEKYVLINPAAKRWGLHANVSRCMNFGPLDKDFANSYGIAASVLTKMMEIVSDGVKFSEVLKTMTDSYISHQIPDGWKQHFPGGVTGYVLADCRCETELKIVNDQAYDWYATMPGVMIEELSVLGENGLEIPSLGTNWPLHAFDNGSEILLPEILVIP